MNRPSAISNQKPSNKESPGSNSFTGEIYQIFKELLPMILKFSQKTRWENTYKFIFPCQHCPDTKLIKDTIKKETYRLIFLR